MSPDLEASYREAARVALARFPVEAQSLELVSVSENVSFRVRSADGDFVLRLHRPGYNSLAELESERLWVDALADAGLRVQRSLNTSSGGHFCEVEVPAPGGPRLVGMTSWLVGEPLGSWLEDESRRSQRPGIFQQIGRLAATLHSQSSAWRPPDGFTRPALDDDGLLGEAPRWGRFWEHPALTSAQRELLLATRRLMWDRLREYGATAATFGLIHADLHADNLLVDGDTLGVIDFDDAAFGWFVYDLATALIEFQDDDDYPQLRSALLAGYRKHRELPARDEAMLETFLLLRGMAIIGWFYQRPEHSQSDYFPENLRRVLKACSRVLDAVDQH